MPVYVDNMDMKWQGMVMSHMIADTTEELLEMVDKIGVQRKWIQKEATKYEHFDITITKKKEALKHGAILITWKQLGTICYHRKDHNDKIINPNIGKTLFDI